MTFSRLSAKCVLQATTVALLRLCTDAVHQFGPVQNHQHGDGKGRATDNIFVERLWRTVKYEEVYLHDYQTPREARQGLSRYFEFYNHRRLHQALDYCTPGEVYSGARGAAPLGGRQWAQQPALSDPAEATTMHLNNGPLPVLTTGST